MERYQAGFGRNGFGLLLNRGLVYTNVHYLHANTETVVGHVTLATGAGPSNHGMVANAWFDHRTGRQVYNIEDARYPILATGNDSPAVRKQLDPSKKGVRSDGRSPAALLAPTLADTMAAYWGGRSRIFVVSGKDRGAVPLAGGAGKAFWYSTDSGDFATSTYYYSEYPGWATQWNARRPAQTFQGGSWRLLNPPETYLLADQDDRPYEADLNGFGRTFPHPFGRSSGSLFPSLILISPRGDELTLDFAKTLMRAEDLGRDGVPDYLSISFSSLDAVNHFFGPSSLENEDLLVHLDRTLADLLAFV